MTQKTKAACEGAIAVGARDILEKEAHDSSRKIDPSVLLERVRIVRSWPSQSIFNDGGPRR
jgi:D-amino peptidase